MTSRYPLPSDLDGILANVRKPVRYIGGEWNSVSKDPASVAVRVALAFPDLYEIGSSHLGLRILYAILNERSEFWAERVFCPWVDLEAELKKAEMPLMSLESFTPLGEFDVVGFSLQSEMNFTNVLTMLDLANIPLRASERRQLDPLIIGGGPAVFNPEPVAPFFDAFLIGDCEELLPEFLLAYRALRDSGLQRGDILARLSGIEGVYVPSLYAVERDAKTGFLLPRAKGNAPFPVRRRILMDLDRHQYPQRVVVPHGEIVHDRVAVEIMRGCTVGCRFCQAGIIYRPLRQRHPLRILETARGSLRQTGLDEVSLTSLNSGEYHHIASLIEVLMDDLARDHVALSLSSLRPSSISERLASQVRRVRKTGFTLAPEAGTQRLRRAINKNVTEEEILEGCETAFRQGWEQLKLYFMIGLPTETDEDVLQIARLGNEVAALGRRVAGRNVRIHLSASSFIPKPHTPFQWCAQDSRESLRRKQNLIRKALDARLVNFKWHDVEASFLEALLSSGDRSLGPVIETAWRSGCRMDAWSEMYRHDLWMLAIERCGVDPDLFAHRRLESHDPLPWDVIDPGVGKDYLFKEYEAGLRSRPRQACTPDLCDGCGEFAKECMSGRLLKGLEVVDMAGHGRAVGCIQGGGESATPNTGAMARVRSDPRGRYRYRARYFKRRRMKFLSHLDVARTVIRALRRAGVPMAYSEGFRPAPRLSFAGALQVGVESRAEYLDMVTSRPIDGAAVLTALNSALPEGLGFDRLLPVDSGAPSLMASIHAARYRIEPPAAPRETHDVPSWHRRQIRSFLGHESVMVVREREGHREEIDARPAVRELHYDPASGTLILTLSLGEGRTPRPSEIVKGLYGPEAVPMRVEREELLALHRGSLVSPLAFCEQGGEVASRDLNR